MVSAKFCVVLAPPLSVTCAVKLNVPAVVGVPLITPVVAFRFRPAGRKLCDIDHEKGVVPPAVAIVVEYAVAAVAGGSVVVVIVSAVAMVIERSRVTAAPALSATRTVKLETPFVEGVPVITPVAATMLRPVGNVPAVTDHVRGEVPPAETTV